MGFEIHSLSLTLRFLVTCGTVQAGPSSVKSFSSPAPKRCCCIYTPHSPRAPQGSAGSSAHGGQARTPRSARQGQHTRRGHRGSLPAPNRPAGHGSTARGSGGCGRPGVAVGAAAAPVRARPRRGFLYSREGPSRSSSAETSQTSQTSQSSRWPPHRAHRGLRSPSSDPFICCTRHSRRNSY